MFRVRGRWENVILRASFSFVFDRLYRLSWFYAIMFKLRFVVRALNKLVSWKKANKKAFLMFALILFT